MTAAPSSPTPVQDPAQPADTQPAETPTAEAEPTGTEPADSQPARPNRLKRALVALGLAVTSCRAFVMQPSRLVDAWNRSSEIDSRRIPANSETLEWLWWFSNRTDRLLWFALYFICPAGLAGAWLHIGERASRRWCAYGVLAIVTGAVAFLARS